MAKRRRTRRKLHGAALAAHQRKANRGKRRRSNRTTRRRAHARTAPRRSNRRRTRRNVSHTRRRVSVATRRRRRSNSHHASHKRRRRHNASRRRVSVRARRRHNAYPVALNRKRRHNRRRRRNPGLLSSGKGLVKDVLGTAINGAVDSLFGAGGWMAAQAGAHLIPITDTGSTEILGLQPLDTLKRLGTSIVLGFLASKMKVSPIHVRMLVMGGFLNTTLSVVESLIPTSLAGGLGLYPGQPQLAGMGDAFVAQGFFPPLPGGTHGDYHGDPAFMGAYPGRS